MQGAFLHIQGQWAQFRKPETNNTPLTHDFLTKTALVGLIGAVLGIERQEMRSLFPVLCEDLVYGVQVRRLVNKVSWGFTLRNVNQQNNPSEKAPRQMEFLRNPDYTVALALRDVRSQETFTQFITAIQSSEARYTPVLGLHNCPAELGWIGETEFEAGNGTYQTQGFALRKHRLVDPTNLRVGFERIPTYQDNDWWNVPDRYREVVYPSNGGSIVMDGEHFRSNGGEWCLI